MCWVLLGENVGTHLHACSDPHTADHMHFEIMPAMQFLIRQIEEKGCTINTALTIEVNAPSSLTSPFKNVKRAKLEYNIKFHLEFTVHECTTHNMMNRKC